MAMDLPFLKEQLQTSSNANKKLRQERGGAGTFLMEHNPKSTRGVGGYF